MKFYRYYDYYSGAGIKIGLETWYLHKKTPCGYCISPYKENQTDSGHRSLEMKWVSKTSTKRYAYPTKEQAMENFKARKKRQIKLLGYQLKKAEIAFSLVGGKLEEQRAGRFLGHSHFKNGEH